MPIPDFAASDLADDVDPVVERPAVALGSGLGLLGNQAAEAIVDAAEDFVGGHVVVLRQRLAPVLLVYTQAEFGRGFFGLGLDLDGDPVGVVGGDLEVALQPVDVVVIELLGAVLIVPVIVGQGLWRPPGDPPRGVKQTEQPVRHDYQEASEGGHPDGDGQEGHVHDAHFSITGSGTHTTPRRAANV